MCDGIRTTVALKTGRPPFRKGYGDISNDTNKTGQAYVLRRGQACVEKHFLVELRGNV